MYHRIGNENKTKLYVADSKDDTVAVIDLLHVVISNAMTRLMQHRLYSGR